MGAAIICMMFVTIPVCERIWFVIPRHSEDISPVPSHCTDLGMRLIHCSVCVGTINLKQAGLDGLQSHPLFRTCRSQYQASPAVLG